MTRLVVFDLDGTLIDSQRDLAASTNEMLESYGAAPLPIDDVTRMIGEGARVLVERALTARGLTPRPPDALDRFRRVYDRRLLETTVAYEGIPAMLGAISGRVPLAVLTNKPLDPSRRILDGLELTRHFAWVVGGDGPHPRKPDPSGLRWLIEQAGVSPGDTLLVGDSRIDAETGRHAGVPVCIVSYGIGWEKGDIDTAGVDVADTAADVARLIQTRLAGAPR